MVIDVSKKFIKEMSSGFNSDKVTVHICDGFKFLENHLSQYDVIIADISDPEGKNVVLDSIVFSCGYHAGSLL